MTFTAALNVPALRDIIEGIEDLRASLRDRDCPVLARLLKNEIVKLATYGVAY